MPRQDTSKPRTRKQNEILDLEKKYFSILEKVFSSSAFNNDLLLIEKEIRENYPKFINVWNLKNKLKVPAERLVRHHIYMSLSNLITGIYPSPISSDIGFLTDDCVICIDVKTVDTVSNIADIKSTQVEPNQISFRNTNHSYVTTTSNLESIDHYSRKPVLTYVLKIIYTDDDYSFQLARGITPSVVLVCIPNGELSNLFNFDIIKSFKTYNYFTESDDEYFTPVIIPNEFIDDDQTSYIERYCIDKGFVKVEIPNKTAYYDGIHHCIWWQTSHKNRPAIKAVKSGSTARLENEILKDRYDSNNNSWYGYKELSIPPALT